MADHHTFFGKLIAGVLSIFKTSVQKSWNELTPEEQQNLKDASGLINIINTHLKDVPQAIKDAIAAQFPNVDINVLETELLAVCDFVHLPLNQRTIDDAIAAIQAYLVSKEGSVWEWASSALAELISVIRMPTTVFAKISMLVEYAYRTFIKKD